MIDFRTLGGLELRQPDGAPATSVLTHPKRTALLAYLALSRPDGFHRRDTLVGMFWPESDHARARAALRKALYFLRRSIGADALPSRGDEELGLSSALIRCDAAAFLKALAEGNHARALELYRGDFLEGFYVAGAPEFEQWLELERTRLRRCATNAARLLAEQEERAGNAFNASSWGRRALELAPADENALRQLLQLLDRLGDRTGAQAAYQDYTLRMARDYQIEATAETKLLIQSICARTDSKPVQHWQAMPRVAKRAPALMAPSVPGAVRRWLEASGFAVPVLIATAGALTLLQRSNRRK